MDVDLVITEFEVGGAERALTRLAIGLNELGDSVRVYSIGQLPPYDEGSGRDLLVRSLQDHGIELESGGAIRGGSTIRNIATSARDLRTWMRKRPTAVCQTFLIHANILSDLVAPAGPKSGPRVAGIRVAEPNRLRCWFERRALRRVDHVVCVSEAVKRFSHQHLGLCDDRTSVIGNSVDVDSFANATPMDWRTLGWPVDSKVILFVGRLHPQKNLGLLKISLDRFAPMGGDRKVVLVGEGPLRGELQRWADSVDGDRVRLLPWRPDVASLLSGSRVLVLPSHYEGMPNVVLEAMAAGKPVVCSRVEGSQELIGDDPDQGFDAGDAAGMADRLNRFLQNDGLADRVGRANQIRMREEFSVQQMVHRYRELYSRLAER